MSYTITSQCISCDRCLSTCPTQAIQTKGNHYWIHPDLCNNCAGSYGVPQCWAVCPTNDGCVSGATAAFRMGYALSDPTEYWNRWFDTYNHLIFQLHQPPQDSYWEHWFDRYSQKLATLIQSRKETRLHKQDLHKQVAA
jgi:ferredoxin